MTMNRRKFLKTGAGALAVPALPIAGEDAGRKPYPTTPVPQFSSIQPPPIVGPFPQSEVANNPERSEPNSGEPQLTAGPMIGAVTPSEITFWTRVSGEFPVQIQYGMDRLLADARLSDPVKATKENNFVSVLRIGGLEPDTKYYYRVFVDNKPDSYLGDIPPLPVKTAPAHGKAAKFRVAFGSCPRFQEDPLQPIWPGITMWKPDLFLWLGDNIYGDSLQPQIFSEFYYRQRNILLMQPLIRSVPQLAIWDDHDYGANDQDKNWPIKEQTLAIFKQYWANPAYGLPDTPGVFFQYSYGGVDFFFLDGRYHRDPNLDPDVPGKTMLGHPQMAWLKKGLTQSKAPFKILVSGGGWSTERGPGGDSWSAFISERNALFDFIRDKKIGGVVLLSGDVHFGELNCTPWSMRGGYDYYELVSSPLAQVTSNQYLAWQPEMRIRPAFIKTSNCGMIDFDLTAGDPKLTFQLINVHGHVVWEPLELRASELKNGVKSWPQKKHAEPLISR
jgi:alkaline phosphatase D